MRKTIAALMVTGLLLGTASMAYAAEVVEIGTKAGDTDYVVAVKNDTAEDIVSVKIRVDGAEYGDEMITDTLAAGAEGTLYCTPKEMTGGSAPRYDMKVVFAGGDVAVLHTLPFGDADELSIRLDAAEETAEEETETALEEAVEEEATEAVAEEETEAQADEETQTVAAYIVFVSKSLGSEQNTKQRESDLMNMPAATAAPAAAPAEGEAAAQTWSEPVYEDYSYDSSQDYSYDSSQDYSYDASQDYSYDYSQDYSYQEPAYQEPVVDQGGGGQDEQCEADGVFF